MTNPGFMGQRAGQQASQSATNAARQHASQASQDAMRGAQSAARRGSYQRRSRQLGLLGGLVKLVITLVFLAFAVGVALLILSQAAPEFLDQVTSWFQG